MLPTSILDSVKIKAQRRIMLQRMGFDCKCDVCTGKVSDQEDILRKLYDVEKLIGVPSSMNQADWRRDTKNLAVFADLTQKLHIGSPEFKFQMFFLLLYNAQFARDRGFYEKSITMMKELVESTKLADLELGEKIFFSGRIQKNMA